MRWGRKGKEELDPDTYYQSRRFWWAWFPVWATTDDGGGVWVWREWVEVKRTVELGHDNYGGVCQSTTYTYRTCAGQTS